MINDDNSDSINLENEQIEQKTLNAGEERKIIDFEESKSYTRNIKNKKPKVPRNKSLNKLEKKKLPPIPKSKKNHIHSISKEPSKSSFKNSYSSVSLDQRENSGIFVEINKAQTEIKNINKELKSLKKEYTIIEDRNLTNKYIIEKILDINNNNSNIDSNMDFKSFNNFNSEKNSEEESKNKDDENKNKKKRSKNKFKFQSEESLKIFALKKQISQYNNTLRINSNKIEELRKKKKQMQYQQIIESLNEKSDEIKEVFNKIEDLKTILFEKDTRIKFYSLNAQQYSDDIVKLEQNMKYKNELLTYNQDEIKELNEEKDNLNSKQKILEDTKKEKEKKKDDINEEINKLDKEIEDNKDLLKEKEKNDIFLSNFDGAHKKYLNDINKLESKIKLLTQQYEGIEKDINKYESERPKLLEMSKIPKKNQEKMKLLEKEVNDLKQEIDKRNKESNNTEKDMSNKINNITNMNKDYKTQMDNYKKEKEDLKSELKQCINDLYSKQKEEEELEQEYFSLIDESKKIKKEYDEIKKIEEEMKKKDLLEKEKEENIKIQKEKNFNDAIEKYYCEINELKIKNEELRKKNGKLKIIFDKKMTEVKLAQKTSYKLKCTLEELQRMAFP